MRFSSAYPPFACFSTNLPAAQSRHSSMQRSQVLARWLACAWLPAAKGRGSVNEAPERVVLVEADLASRDALELVLRGAGFDVSSFAAAREGLDAVRQLTPDLLLLNALPCTAANVSTTEQAPLHAHDVVAAIRGSAATEHVRVILLVGPAAEERAAALDLGADDAISQPFDPAELLGTHSRASAGAPGGEPDCSRERASPKRASRWPRRRFRRLPSPRR